MLPGPRSASAVTLNLVVKYNNLLILFLDYKLYCILQRKDVLWSAQFKSLIQSNDIL